MLDLVLPAPTQRGEKAREDASLCEALETCFPNQDDGGWLVWNGLRVPLCYKYDVGILLPDVVSLVQQVRHGQAAQFRVSWASDTFRGSWQLVRRAERVQLTAQWDSVSGRWQDPTLLQQALNAANVVDLSQATLLAHGVAIMQFAHQALVTAGYRRQDLVDYPRLLDELAHHSKAS